jgi:O-antigen ligase
LTRPTIEQAPYALALSAGVAGVFSIAALNILVVAALVCLLWLRKPLRFPPILAPLLLLIAWTLLSAAFAESPSAAWPQVRKFWMWAVLVVVYSAVRGPVRARWVLVAYACAATLSATWGLVQFARKWMAAAASGSDFYFAYVADRITGFMSHWMTFSAEMAIATAVIVALLLFDSRRAAWAAAGVLVFAGLLLGYTRSMWGAAAVSVVFLVWRWRPRYLAALPLLTGAVFFALPGPVAQRVTSIWKPGERDSNDHRAWLRSTGYRMIAAHPLLGVGPEHIKREAVFKAHVPPEAPKPWPADWYYGHLHNVYLHEAAERGLPALAALLWLIGWVLRDLVVGLGGAEGPRRFVLHAVVAAILGVLVAGWWERNLGDSEVLASFLTLVGCGYAALDKDPDAVG